MQALLLSPTSCSSFNYLGHQNYINKLDGGGIHEDQKINKTTSNDFNYSEAGQEKYFK